MSQTPLREHDVVIAGASIAGCTTAILLGRAGLRVALVERNRSIDAYKALCGHWILGGTQPTLRRTGLWQQMIEAGAVAAPMNVWTRFGWIPSDPDVVPAAIGLRRATLDPMLRRIAAATTGVDLLLGHRVEGLIEGNGRVRGVTVTSAFGARRAIEARLVVGADGHRSKVAELAGVPGEPAPNQRFFVWAYYRDVVFPGHGPAVGWRLDPDVAVAVPAGEGLTLVGAFPSKVRAGEFAGDRAAALERFIRDLPEAPRLATATRVSKVIGTFDYPMVRRHPTPRPGLALVGDAAMTCDPLPAVGCGWAFRSAEWLADAVAPALRAGPDGDVDAALADYRAARRFAEAYDDHGRVEALAEPPNPVQDAVLATAVRHPEIAHRVGLFSMRAAPVSVLLDPDLAARAMELASAASVTA